jgi:hypothetical protein
MPERFETYDVFLSFSNHDEHIAKELADRLTSAGLSCFLSAKDLRGGAIWKPSIRDAIRRSDRVLLLITPRSKDSRWVSLETGAAWMEQKDLIPLTQFVEPSELGDIARDYQVRIIETDQQKAALVAELNVRLPRRPQLSFPLMLSKIRLALTELDRARVVPDIVIGSGRDGAVCAGIFAELLGHKKLCVIDCHFAWGGKDRVTTIDTSSITEQDVLNRNVLVVEWARQTGETFALIKNRLMGLRPAALQSFALFWTKGSDTAPDYYAFENSSVPASPWGNSM